MKVAIASGKGGTGKTTLATNLASFISEREKVVLADLDVEEPNSGLFIKGTLHHREDRFKSIPSWDSGRCTLCGLCQEACYFNAVIKMVDDIMIFPRLCHSCYACSELCPEEALPMEKVKIGELRHFRKENLDFVDSSLLIGEEQAVPLISQTKDYLEQNLPDAGLVIMDSPPGTSCPMIEAVKDANLIILVTEPTPFGLHDLSLAVETARELGKPHAVVINRHGIGNDDVIEYCDNEGIEIPARIPNDRRIASLYAEGKLLDLETVREQLEKIARFINNFRKGEGE